MWYNVYWIDWIGGVFTKKKITGYIKDSKEKSSFNTIGIEDENKIVFHIESSKYIIEKNHSPLLIIVENEITKHKIYFSKENIQESNYLLKDNNIKFKLKIKTNSLDINHKYIKINYLVIDSYEEFEFYIEMSDN